MATTVLEDFPSSVITDKTIARMHELVKSAKTDWEWIKFATWLVRGCAPRDNLCELRSIYRRLGLGIVYRKDPHQVELVQNPWAALERRAADCDCMSVLIAAAAGAVGMRYRFVTIKSDISRPDQWSHVYPQVQVPTVGWVAADLSLPKPTLGWEPKGFPKKVWNEPKY